jgi:hypothetical protein
MRKKSVFTQASLRSWIRLLSAILLVLSSGRVLAGSWTGSLHDGSVLKVDPGSRRAMRYYNGGVAPLWDGTHRMENGSVRRCPPSR